MRKLSIISTAKILAALTALVGVLTTADHAAAISVELANKCREMAIKAHPPPIPPGNKAYAASERSFFQECVKNNGEMKDNGSPQDNGAAKESGDHN